MAKPSHSDRLSRPRRRWLPAFAWIMGVLLVVATGLGLPAAESAIRRNKSDDFFESGVIPNIKIEIARTNMVKLRQNGRAYVPAIVREGDRTYEDVGIHLKGAAGSSRALDADPALTLNFDKFRDDQKFHGMDKLHLNNSVQDPSLMTEAICSELFLAAGVPTARTSHARVWLNGRDLGLYVLKEGYDRSFLRRHFQNAKGNLYDGGFLHDITEKLKCDPGEGDVQNYRDLRAVVAAARDSDFARRVGRLEQVLDVERFLSFIAIEILTDHWDGYALKQNNYRVYHDPGSGHCVFIPHGLDQMFWSSSRPLLPLDEISGLVAHSLLETAEGQQRYRARLATLVTNVFTAARLTNHLEVLRARIRPALAAISPARARAHDDAAQHLRNEIVARVRRVQQLAAEPVPEPVEFDAQGSARLTRWHPFDLKESGVLDEVTLDGRKTLHIQAGPNGRCTASWRDAVRLPRGRYVFEGMIRTAEVTPIARTNAAPNIPPPAPGVPAADISVPPKRIAPAAISINTTNAGAGLRISRPRGGNAPRLNGLLGTTDWKKVEYTFTVTGDSAEHVLVCELQADRGEAWFDLSSLRLRRQPTESAPKP